MPRAPRGTRSMGTCPFDAAGKGRRGIGWNPSYLGVNTLLFSHGLELLTRNRDAVRNSAWAAGAVDSYVANAIGRGIRMIPQHPDEQVRELIRKKWKRWIRESDVEYDPNNPASGQTDFYGQQMIIAREVMEAGEVFVRFRPRSPKEGLAVPLQLQLIEAEQLPLWRIQPTPDMPEDNRVRCGIEFRPDGRRAAYHFWRAHPGETMFFPLEALSGRARASHGCAARVQADSRRPVSRPAVADVGAGEALRTGAVHGRRDRPQEGRGDDHRVHQAGQPGQSDHPARPAPERSGHDRPGRTDLETRTGNVPGSESGEEVEFAEARDSGDFKAFIRTCLQAFASGAGLAEYQISGDLSGINYSSIRAGLLEFRRKCEQFQYSVFTFQVCHPIYRRWLREAMLALVFGVELLTAYDKDPEPFEEVQWVTPGWPWVDPDKDMKAAERAIRDGLSTRSIECAEQGYDAALIDTAAEDRQRPRRQARALLRLRWPEDPHRAQRRHDRGRDRERRARQAERWRRSEASGARCIAVCELSADDSPAQAGGDHQSPGAAAGDRPGQSSWPAAFRWTPRPR